MKAAILLLLLYLVSLSSVLAQDTSAIAVAATTTEQVAQTTVETAAATTTAVAETSVIATTATTNVVASTSASAPASTSSAVDTGDCLTADTFSTHDYFPNKLDFSKLGILKRHTLLDE
jgi:hypothetical protein